MAGLDLSGIGSVADLIHGAIDKIWPDKTEQEKSKFLLLAQELSQNFQLALNQISTNIEEAKSNSVFVAGWRPFVGWVCGFGFAWQYVLGPFFYWVSDLFGSPTPIPQLDIGELGVLLFGMLGMSGMRSYDKTKGANGK